MSGFALTLVLVAAVIHATWNLLSKKAGGDAVFVWLCSTASAVIFGPLAIGVVIVEQPRLGWIELSFLLTTAVCHTGYFVFLQRGYRTGELSVVYPLARSTGPLLSTLVAIMVLGEHPTGIALAGGGLVLAGIVALSWNPQGHRNLRMGPAIGYGVLTGSFIAAYTLFDKYAVSSLHLPPILVDYGSSLGRSLILLPVVVKRREQARWEWKTKRASIVAVALLCPIAYILVLTAMAFTPVSYIAPAREISILVGMILGSRFLGEGHSPRRLAAGGAMVAGIVALALG
jgi:drug/metabolite transporter (DMT)-like permease